VIPPDEVDALLLVAAVWVDWAASDADAVYRNNREAATGALRAGTAGHPPVAEVLAARHRPENAYYRGGESP
jgi:5,6,7,8-tetrahydromethanopterin hydro-lyase